MAPQKYYTVGVSNKFAAFGADSDASSDEGEVILAAPPSIPTEQQQQQQQGSAALKKKEAPQQQQQVSPQRERQRGRAPRSSRGGFSGEGHGAYRGSRGRPEVAGEASEELHGVQAAPLEGDGGHRRRGGFRGRRGGGGPPGGLLGAPSAPRREYDRHSATGRGREIKKQGAGGHNWGQEDHENQPQKVEAILAEEQAVKEEGQQEPEAAEEQQGGKEGAPIPQEVEQEPTIDLDTYKKMQAEKRANLPTFVSGSASSKPIETDKELAAQGYIRIDRGGDADTEGGPEESPETREDRPKKKSINLYEYVHIEGGRVPSFSRRGGRGGGRGGKEEGVRRGGGGGGPRSGRGRESAPDLKDTQAFPNLGAR